MSRRLAFPWLAYAFFVTMAGTTLPTPLYPIYQQRFGFGDLIVTVIFAIYAAGVIAGLILTGRLSDEIGRRRVLGFGLACAAISAALFVVAQGVAPMLVARVFSGLSAGSFAGAATAVLVDLAPRGRRDFAAMLAVAVNLGGLGAGSLIGGLIAGTGVESLRLPYWVHLGLLVPAAAAVLLAPETVRRAEHPRFSPQRLAVPREVRATFAPAALGGFSAFATGGVFGAVGPTFMSKFLGYDSHVLGGSLTFVLFMASVVSQLAISRLPDDVSSVAAAVAVLTAALLTIACVAANSLALLFAAGASAGIGQGLSVGGGVAALSRDSPQERRGEVIATFFVVIYVALGIPTVAVGLVSHAAGLRTAAVALGCAVAAMAVATGVILARQRRALSPARP